MHRTVDNHTTNMVRARTKCEIDREIPGLGLPGHRDFTNSYTNTRTWGILRDGQGYHHLLPTPQPWSTVIFEGSLHPSTMPVHKKTTHIPLGLQPYGWTSKNIGKPEGTTNHHLNPSSTSTHTSHMNVEA
jgi:hypothetical protein